MSRKMKFRIGICLFAIFTTLFVLYKRTNNETFIKEKHVRDNEISRTFEMLTLEKQGLKFHTEITANNKNEKHIENCQRELLQVSEFVKDVEEIINEFGINKRLKYTDIYFINNAPNGDIYLYDKVILVDKEIIGTEQLKRSLICSLYDCEEWVAYGLNEYRKNTKPDEEFLKKYYAKDENIADLSLFGGKFYEFNKDKEEFKAVRETAISLFDFVVKEKDVNVLFDMETSATERILEWKNEWLKKRNENAVYVNEKENLVREIRFYPGNEEYPVRMYWDQCIFYLNDTVFSHNRIEDLSDFEYEILLAMNDVLGINTYLTEMLSATMLTKLEKEQNINVYFRDTKASYRSYAGFRDGIISLTDIGAFAHEYTHHIIKNLGGIETSWLSEGMADYLGSVMFGKSKARYYTITELELVDKLYDKTSEVYIWGKKIDEQYFVWDGSYDEKEFNFRLLAMAQVYLVKTVPEFRDSKWMQVASLGGIYGSQIKNGTESWTYEESMLFTEYLIKHFGLEKVMEFNFNCSNSNFERIFGDTLLNLHTEWEKEFLEECTQMNEIN